MKGFTQKQLKNANSKKSNGSFINMEGEVFYYIENYDQMADFFMTITSSSDVWNTLWSKGGITAGRIDCDHALFPYYTADKISDAKTYTGSYTALLVKNGEENYIWEPFSDSADEHYSIKRNLYKNTSGSKVYFEELNYDLGLKFRYGWTSSSKFGLVKQSRISVITTKGEQNYYTGDRPLAKANNCSTPNTDTAFACSFAEQNYNTGDRPLHIQILDGCRNILPACVDADFQNKSSVLLDAYKKTDFDAKTGLTLFTVSSIVTDKAEPSEGLYANVSWFTTDGKILTNPDDAQNFLLGNPVNETTVLKGKRPSCFILKDIELSESEEWYQVFDTWLNNSRVLKLQQALTDKTNLTKELIFDIQKNIDDLEQLISEADGIQNTNDQTASVHHKANVLFNIMRGGILSDNGNIHTEDFIKFTAERNKALLPQVKELLKNQKELITHEELSALAEKSENPQIIRLYLEYLPLIFSRRHGDPSRPWNRFCIRITDSNNERIFNYEGNWRDIFQNWEALCMSYPQYTQNIIAKFLNAMTIDGFNPYKLSRDGVAWEIPEPNNPWSNIGYWNDHQVIYLQKLLELQFKLDEKKIYELLNKKLFSTANVPYRLKAYSDILKNPRSTVVFDDELSQKLLKAAANEGSDAKLFCVDGKTENVELSTMMTKLVQIILAKLANFVPGGGIWLNNQRPEWNDANNALAGYGLSMVTLYYLYRMISFLTKILEADSSDNFTKEFVLSEETADFLKKMTALYQENEPSSLLDWENEDVCTKRKNFVDAEEILFQEQRDLLYKNGHSKTEIAISKEDFLTSMKIFLAHIEETIKVNKRNDGLYHAYNILHISENAMSISGLTAMLEGQVAVLSSGFLSTTEAVEMTKALKNSSLYVQDRNTYILYPNKELPLFWTKNNLEYGKIKSIPVVQKLVKANDKRLIICDDESIAPNEKALCHFHSDFRNAEFMNEAVSKILAKEPDFLSKEEIQQLENLYENTFHHQSFTGRSGTFYAYEGLGSVYWHMVAKLMLAVQEYVLKAENPSEKQALVQAYYSVRSGIGFNKTPEEYGAVPTDPYSHTPEGQGAKQPGMTGQVKEEIITRWSELGMEISSGKISFNPDFLQEKEYKDGTLSFTRFGIPFEYKKSAEKTITVTFADGTSKTEEGTVLSAELSQKFFCRDKKIASVVVGV